MKLEDSPSHIGLSAFQIITGHHGFQKMVKAPKAGRFVDVPAHKMQSSQSEALLEKMILTMRPIMLALSQTSGFTMLPLGIAQEIAGYL